MEEFKTLLTQQIQHIITYETSKWAIEYVCKPSLFISSKTSDFYEQNQKICQFESEFILDTQEADGTWAITWSWDDYPEQWAKLVEIRLDYQICEILERVSSFINKFN